MANLPDLRTREVVIGGGVHAAVYCTTRRALGYPYPLVLEKTSRLGGIFAQASVPFWMNSVTGSVASTGAGPTRIRPYSESDDLNHLPNCTIQTATSASTEYPSNTDMAGVVRRNLANCADIYYKLPVRVTRVTSALPQIEVQGETVDVGRLIDARGLAMKFVSTAKAGTPVITAEHYLTGQLPPSVYDGLARRVALIGYGDTARVIAESLLGQGPAGRPFSVSEIGWYGADIPLTKEQWMESVHARYLGLARHMPQAGVTGMIRPFPGTAEAVSLGAQARVNSRETYDLAIYCTGFQPAFKEDNVRPTDIGLGSRSGLWRSSGNYHIVGPAADIPFSAREATGPDGEFNAGYTRFPANTGAIFRLAPATAQLAATLPEVPGEANDF